MEPWDPPPPSSGSPTVSAATDDEGGGDRRARRGGGDESSEGDVVNHRGERSNGIVRGISDIEDPSSPPPSSSGAATDNANQRTPGVEEVESADVAAVAPEAARAAVTGRQQSESEAGEVSPPAGLGSGAEATVTGGGAVASASLEAAALAVSIEDRAPGPPAASGVAPAVHESTQDPARASAAPSSTFLDWPGHREKKREKDRRPMSHQELLRRQAAAASSEADSPAALPSGAALPPSWERRPPQAALAAAGAAAARASSVPALGVPSRPAAAAAAAPPRGPQHQHVHHEQQRQRQGQGRRHAADSFDSDPYCAPHPPSSSSSGIPMPGWSAVETSTTQPHSSSPYSPPPRRDQAQVQVPVVDEFGNELVAAPVPPPPAPGGLPPCPRSLHSAAVLDGVMYVFGGYDGQARVNDFYGFSFAEMRWHPVVPAVASGPPPSPRDRHISIAYRNMFYIFGGFDGRARVSDFYGFNVNSMTWQEIIHLSGSPPSPRHSHAAVVFNDSMYVFGGYDGSYRSDLNEFDFLTSSWKTVQASGRLPRARYRATCVVHNNFMILFGGHDGTRHLADAHVFDFETRVWSGLETEGAPPLPRDSHVSVMHGNSMYVFGGSTGSAMNDLHELRFPSGGGDSHVAKWSPIMSASDADIPRHRFCHVGVVYCDSMFVFGGYDGSSRLNDFIRFDFGVGNTTCEVQPSSLISDLRSFVNSEELSDITFIIEGQHVHAHKFMLVRSSYFRAMFLGEMREATQPTIPLEHVSLPVFLLLLEYLYTDEVNVSLEFAMELFAAADEFCVPRLKAICEKQMLASITVDNAASLFLASDLHSADSLKCKTLNFILGNFEQVSKTSTFEEMARTNVELVFEILRNR